MITTILLLVILGLIVHYYKLQYGKVGRFLSLIPGPKVLPIVGSMYVFHFTKDDTWGVIRRLNKTYYPIYKVWNFSDPVVNIRHPNDVETILGSTKILKKSFEYKLLHPWFATGLLTSSDQKWQTRRKILTPAFHFNVLRQFMEIIVEEAERMINSLKEDKKPIDRDLLPLVSGHTLNIICETAMGSSVKDKQTHQQQYRQAVYDMGKILIYRFIRPWFYNDRIFSLVPLSWHQTKLLKILHGFTTKIITERKDYHNKTDGRYLTSFDGDNTKDKVEDDNYLGIRKRRLAMLDLLIAAHRNNQIDDVGIREEVDTFMFEGHDTTAISICLTIMLFAEHKEIQDRARAEVNDALQETEGKVSMTVLQRLPYLERCIKESLRLYPSVHLISREVEHDVQLSNYLVPANTTIHVNIFDVHRDPNFWSNPDDFDPDRFLPERIQGRHPYSYVPFSAGPRNCIGQRFAMMEMKTTIALLLYNFSFEPVDYLKDMKVVADLVIRPTHPLRTKFIPIQQ